MTLRTEVYIEALVLDGFEPASAEAIAASMRRELTILLAEWPTTVVHSRVVERLEHVVAPAAVRDAAAAAAAAARAVNKGALR